MMLVPNEAKLSDLHGLGVFATSKIPKGTIIWRYNPKIDHSIREVDLVDLPPHVQEYVKHYSYFDEGEYVFCGDSGRYMNHSETPNTFGRESEDGYGETVALRDIEPGEEITGDYREFDLDFDRKRTTNPFN